MKSWEERKNFELTATIGVVSFNDLKAVCKSEFISKKKPVYFEETVHWTTMKFIMTLISFF